MCFFCCRGFFFCFSRVWPSSESPQKKKEKKKGRLILIIRRLFLFCFVLFCISVLEEEWAARAIPLTDPLVSPHTGPCEVEPTVAQISTHHHHNPMEQKETRGKRKEKGKGKKKIFVQTGRKLKKRQSLQNFFLKTEREQLRWRRGARGPAGAACKPNNNSAKGRRGVYYSIYRFNEGAIVEETSRTVCDFSGFIESCADVSSRQLMFLILQKCSFFSPPSSRKHADKLQKQQKLLSPTNL